MQSARRCLLDALPPRIEESHTIYFSLFFIQCYNDAWSAQTINMLLCGGSIPHIAEQVIILNDRIQRDGERTVTQSPDSHVSASVFSYRSLLTFTLLPKSMSPTSRRPSSRRTKVYPSLWYSAIAGSSPSSTWVEEV